VVTARGGSLQGQRLPGLIDDVTSRRGCLKRPPSAFYPANAHTAMRMMREVER